MEQMKARTLINTVSRQVKMLYRKHPEIEKDVCKDLAWSLFRAEAALERNCDVWDRDIEEIKLSLVDYSDGFLHKLIKNTRLWDAYEKEEIMYRIQSCIRAIDEAEKPASDPTRVIFDDLEDEDIII